MPPPREIPGFYWDEERQRHFKIQPNHRQDDPRYSSASVSQKRRQADRQVSAQDAAALQARRIHRISSCRPTATLQSLFREISQPTTSSLVISNTAALATHLQPSHALPQHIDFVRHCLSISRWPIRAVRDPRDGSLWTAGDLGEDAGVYCHVRLPSTKTSNHEADLFNPDNTNPPPPDPGPPANRFAFLGAGHPRPLLRLNHDSSYVISTLACSPRLGLCTALAAVQPSGATSAHLFIETHADLAPYPFMRPVASIEDVAIPPTGLAIHPTADMVAMAVDGNAYISNPECGCRWRLQGLAEESFQPQRGPGGKKSDVLQLAWMDDNILIAGRRDGGVVGRDIRVDLKQERPIFDMQCGQPGSSVQHLYPLTYKNAYQMLVCGMRSHLALYDVRSAIKRTSDPHLYSYPSNPSPARHTLKGHADRTRQATAPIMNYEHHNNHMAGLGFDANTNLDLIASGSDSQPGIVLFQLSTGRRHKMKMETRPRNWTANPRASIKWDKIRDSMSNGQASSGRMLRRSNRIRNQRLYHQNYARDDDDYDYNYDYDDDSDDDDEMSDAESDAVGNASSLLDSNAQRISGAEQKVTSIDIWENNRTADPPCIVYTRGKQICVLEWG